MQTRVILSKHAKIRIRERGDKAVNISNAIKGASSQILSAGIRAGDRRVALVSPRLKTVPVVEVSPHTVIGFFSYEDFVSEIAGTISVVRVQDYYRFRNAERQSFYVELAARREYPMEYPPQDEIYVCRFEVGGGLVFDRENRQRDGENARRAVEALRQDLERRGFVVKTGTFAAAKESDAVAPGPWHFEKDEQGLPVLVLELEPVPEKKAEPVVLVLDSEQQEALERAEYLLGMEGDTILHCLVDSLHNPCTREVVREMLDTLDREERAEEEAAAWLDMMRSVMKDE